MAEKNTWATRVDEYDGLIKSLEKDDIFGMVRN